MDKALRSQRILDFFDFLTLYYKVEKQINIIYLL